jgi:hypothetical protein
MTLMEHATRELSLANMYSDDHDAHIARCVLDLVQIFSEQGHSGMSALITIEIFNRVARYQTLTPITDNPREWSDHGDLWQSERQSSLFSNDGGKTYWDVDNKDVIHTSERYINASS